MPKLTGEQLVLAGDAGHVIHPLAGQGYNLALGDAAVLADAIAAASDTRARPSDNMRSLKSTFSVLILGLPSLNVFNTQCDGGADNGIMRC